MIVMAYLSEYVFEFMERVLWILMAFVMLFCLINGTEVPGVKNTGHQAMVQWIERDGLSRGWYVSGDCCSMVSPEVPKAGVASVQPGCLDGPYGNLAQALKSASCQGHLKYGRKTLYIS